MIEKTDQYHVSLVYLIRKDFQQEKKDVIKHFANFARKHRCWSLFLIQLQASRPGDFDKKRLQHRRLPVNLMKFIRTPILKNLMKSIRTPILKNSCKRPLIKNEISVGSLLRCHRFCQIVHQFSTFYFLYLSRARCLCEYRFIIQNLMNTFRLAFVEVYVEVLLL